MPRPLRHESATAMPRRRMAAFDIETVGFGGAIVGIGWKVEGDEAVTLSTDPMALCAQFLLARKHRRVLWYAHNAGGFDLLHLLPYLRQTGASIDIIWQGKSGRCIGMILRRGSVRTEIRDSFAIFPGSLLDMTTKLAPELMKMTGAIDFEQESYDPENALHRAYLTRDVDGLLTSVTRLWDIVRDAFDCWPRWTLGSTAIRAWQQTIPEQIVFWPMRRECEDYCRLGYFGGLTFMRWYGERTDVSAADINAMYPSVMRDFRFPVGTPRFTHNYERNRLGIWHVRCHVPTSIALPILPMRHKSGVRWPHGEFETYCTSPEIDYARELGCKVEVLAGYVWPDSQYLFVDFVDRAEALRKPYTDAPDDPMSFMVKILQNALYGKFGAKREGEDTVVTDDYMWAQAEGYVPATNGRTGESIPSVWTRPSYIDSSYIQPHWAAFVTAYARIRLHKLVMSIGVDKVFYGDTDSAWCETSALRQAITDGRIMHSKWHYGDVKIEGPYERVEWIASKVYASWDRDGKFRLKAKGIPKRHRTESSWLNRDLVIRWEGMTTMRTFLQSGELTGQRKRGWSQIRNSKSWTLAADGHTVMPWVEVMSDGA